MNLFTTHKTKQLSNIARAILPLFVLVSILATLLIPTFAEAQIVGTLSNEPPIEDALYPAGVTPTTVSLDWWEKILVDIFAIPRAIGGFFMAITGNFLDLVIQYSVGQLNYNAIPGIQIAWQNVRDIANLFFIFVLLYIAIGTILQILTHNTKKLVATVVIIALLINFSALFTKIVIDASNIIGVEFYNRMMTIQPVGGCPSGACSLSEKISALTGIQAIQKGSGTTLPMDKQIMVHLLAALMFFVTGYVFFVGALLLLARAIALAFLIVFSPAAFIAYTLPGTKKYANKWWSTLVSYCLLMPAYFLTMYIALSILSGGGFTVVGGGSGVSNQSLLINFMLMTGLMYMASKIAFSFAGSAGATAVGWGKMATGAAVGAAAGATAFAGRRYGGRAAKWASETKAVQTLAAKSPRVGALALRNLDKAAKSSWDIRNAPGAAKVGTLTGGAIALKGTKTGAGGYKEIQKRKRAQTLGTAELIKDKEQREQYLAGRESQTVMGTALASKPYTRPGQGAGIRTAKGKDLEEHYKTDPKMRAERERLRREIDADKAKKTVTDKVGEAQKLHEEGREIGQGIAEEIATAVKKLNAKEVAELTPKELTNSTVVSNLNKAQVAAISQRAMSGEYTDPDFVDNFSKAVNTHGSKPVKKYIQNSPGGSIFGLDEEVATKTEGPTIDTKTTLGQAKAQRGQKST